MQHGFDYREHIWLFIIKIGNSLYLERRYCPPCWLLPVLECMKLSLPEWILFTCFFSSKKYKSDIISYNLICNIFWVQIDVNISFFSNNCRKSSNTTITHRGRISQKVFLYYADSNSPVGALSLTCIDVKPTTWREIWVAEML